jgi:hypothetical protein
MLAIAALMGACTTSEPITSTVKTPEQAITIAKTMCGDATKFHPGTWQTRLKNHTWLVWSEDGILNVWVFVSDPDRSVCVDESN